VEARGGREAIIITELPFQVNKKTLQERIGELVREKRIEGISRSATSPTARACGW
jgi:DNA gyrase subunit A